MNALTLTFENVEFDVVDRDGQVWLRGPQIGGALGYAKGKDSILKLYESNAAEFSDDMTAIIRLHTAGGMQDVRVFSLRGAHLLGMFARTDKAAAFRRWVLDVLDGLSKPLADEADTHNLHSRSENGGEVERSEQLVSGARIFNAILRVGRQLRLSQSRAAATANMVALRHTGVDVLREMAVLPEELLAATELTVAGGEADQLAQRIQDWLAASPAADVTNNEIIAGLGLAVDGHERRTAEIRIGILMSRLGWKRREQRNNILRRRIYLRPAPQTPSNQPRRNHV